MVNSQRNKRSAGKFEASYQKGNHKRNFSRYKYYVLEILKEINLGIKMNLFSMEAIRMEL